MPWEVAVTLHARIVTLIGAFVLGALALAAQTLASDPRAEQLWQESRGKTYADALPYLLEAAKLGHPRAQSALGHYYWGRQDYAQARHWYELAAAQGVRDAQYNLAGMYTQGLGVPINLRKANELLYAGARQDYAPAQEALRISCEFGEGVARNRQNAIHWLDRAAAQGSQSAATFASILRSPTTPQFANETQFVQWYNAQQQRAASAQGQRCHVGLEYVSCNGPTPTDSIGQQHTPSGRQCNTLLPRQICH
jgi:TPR repeat protein